jgi:hypothetical protein
MMIRRSLCSTLVCSLALSLLAGVAAAEEKADKAAKKKGEKRNVTSLFDGKTLKGWTKTNFGGEGEVEVKDGNLVLNIGSDLTGITVAEGTKLPTNNFELSCEAQRVDGGDFFCGMTFPVHKGHCSLILGGWGGGVCGISCLDGADASENETTFYRDFKNGQWYKVKVRVTDNELKAWIDDKEIFTVEDLKTRKIDTRIEVDLTKPLGFSTWRTSAALRNIEIRQFVDKQVKAAAKTE